MGSLRTRLAKELRRRRGDVPQIVFAKRLGISKSSYNRMERGEQNISLDTVERICARLRCRVGDLLDS